MMFSVTRLRRILGRIGVAQLAALLLLPIVPQAVSAQQIGRTYSAALPAPAAGEISIPTWDDELYLEFHRGVFTTQANHKRSIRR